MFVVEFLLKEQSKTFRKFLRKNKVGNGKRVSLSVAEQLIQSYQTHFKQKDSTVLQFLDLDNEKAYEFELPIEANATFTLLKAVERDLEAENVDFSLAMEIKQGLFNTYKEEQSQMTRQTQNMQSATGKGGFFEKFFRTKSAPTSNETNESVTQQHIFGGVDSTNDTRETNITEVETKFDDYSNVLDDFVEMNEEEMEGNRTSSFDEEQISDFEEATQELLADHGETIKVSELNEEVYEELGEESEANLLDEIENELAEESKEDVPKENNFIKEVAFPIYDDYVDLSEGEVKKRRYESRFNSKHLLNLLGIKEDSISDLELRKLQYAKQMLNSSEFLLIEDSFHQELKNMNDEIRLHLQSEYHQAMLRDYLKEAEKELNATFEEQNLEMLNKYSNYEEKEENALRASLEAFKEKQQLALKEFQLSQETALKEYQDGLEHRKNNLVNAKGETMEKEKNQIQKQLIQDKIYELKLIARKELLDKKNEALLHFSNTLDELMNSAYNMQQEELKRIQEAIHDQSPIWLQEIEDIRQAELRKKELELEEQRIAIEKRKLHGSEVENTDKEVIRALQEQLKEREEQLQRFYGNGLQQPMYQQIQQPIYQQSLNQHPQQSMYQHPMYQQAQQGHQQPTEQRTGIRKWLFG